MQMSPVPRAVWMLFPAGHFFSSFSGSANDFGRKLGKGGTSRAHLGTSRKERRKIGSEHAKPVGVFRLSIGSQNRSCSFADT